MAVYLLKKAILWKNKFVKVIIVFYIHNHSEEMVECLQRFLSYQKNVDSLVQMYDNQDAYQYISNLD